MKISVVMATYNGAHFLSEQLGSLAAQDRPPDELVVCDDASTDNTVAVLEEFVGQAPFLVHIRRNGKNLGYVANFAQALSLAKGDLIFLADQDDVWLSHKLSTFEKCASASPSTLLFFCDQVHCDASLTPGVTESENLRRLGWPLSTVVTGCCSAVRRELIPIALPMPSHGLPHDDWLHLIAGGLNRREYIGQALQLSRRHESNTSNAGISNPAGVTRPSLHKRFLVDKI